MSEERLTFCVVNSQHSSLTAHTNTNHMPRGNYPGKAILTRPSPQRDCEPHTLLPPSECVILCLLEGDFLKKTIDSLTHTPKKERKERKQKIKREKKTQRAAIKRQLCLYIPHQMNGWGALVTAL